MSNPSNLPITADQTRPIRDQIDRGTAAQSLYLSSTQELASEVARNIDLQSSQVGYLVILPMTFASDSSLSFAVIADAFDGMGVWGHVLAGGASAAIATAAICAELIAGRCYHSSRSGVTKAAMAVLGLIPAAGIVYVLWTAQQALAVNAGAAGSGMDAKLTVFGGLALMFHLLLFMTGERVLIGLGQFFARRRVRTTRSRRDRERRTWTAASRAALDLDHSLTLQMAAYCEQHAPDITAEPNYDPRTDAYLRLLRRHVRRNSILDLDVFLRDGIGDPESRLSSRRSAVAQPAPERDALLPEMSPKVAGLSAGVHAHLLAKKEDTQERVNGHVQPSDSSEEE